MRPEQCLSGAVQYRPELRQTQFQETIDSLRVNLSLTERYPTVTLGASYEWIGEKVPLDKSNWNATININVPVFDGWASWARIRQRKYQAREGKIRRSRIEDQIRFDVRQAYTDYSFWKKQIETLVSFPPPENREPERRLEAALVRLDTLEEALVSKAALDWAIGKPFFK
ncbi:MAG: TolC family protein [Endomicrobiales bacterium]